MYDELVTILGPRPCDLKSTLKASNPVHLNPFSEYAKVHKRSIKSHKRAQRGVRINLLENPIPKESESDSDFLTHLLDLLRNGEEKLPMSDESLSPLPVQVPIVYKPMLKYHEIKTDETQEKTVEPSNCANREMVPLNVVFLTSAKKPIPEDQEDVENTPTYPRKYERFKPRFHKTETADNDQEVVRIGNQHNLDKVNRKYKEPPIRYENDGQNNPQYNGKNVFFKQPFQNRPRGLEDEYNAVKVSQIEGRPDETMRSTISVKDDAKKPSYIPYDDSSKNPNHVRTPLKPRTSSEHLNYANNEQQTPENIAHEVNDVFGIVNFFKGLIIEPFIGKIFDQLLMIVPKKARRDIRFYFE